MHKQYFTTGEFAKLCNISKQTLIFYDKSGVFSPDYKDDNNYRYYSIHQYDTLDILLSLREIGMSLDEIKNYINNRNPNLCLEMLEEENKKIKDKIKKLKIISSKIQKKIDITIEGISKVNEGNVYVKNEDEEYLILSKLEEDSDGDYMMSIIDFSNYCKSKNLYQGYEIGSTLSRESLRNKEYSNLETLYIKVNKKIKNKNFFIKPKGTYACINHVGRYEDIYKSYEKLIKYIDENGYKIIGKSYEKTILDFFSASTEEDYLSEISIQVSKEDQK